MSKQVSEQASKQTYSVRAIVPVTHEGTIYNPGDVFTVEKTEDELAFALAQGIYEEVEPEAEAESEAPKAKKKAKAPKAEAVEAPAETAEPIAEG